MQPAYQESDFPLTWPPSVGIYSNMKAKLLLQRRVVTSVNSFVEIVVWRLPEPLPPCAHPLKYRLALVVEEVCVLRYDNERGKGDHRHEGRTEAAYSFTTPERLLADFLADVERWNHEHGRA